MGRSLLLYELFSCVRGSASPVGQRWWACVSDAATLIEHSVLAAQLTGEATLVIRKAHLPTLANFDCLALADYISALAAAVACS